MKKEKSVIDKFIDLINKRYKTIERHFDEAIDLQEALEKLNQVFYKEDSDDFSYLSTVASEDFHKAIAILVKEDEKDLVNRLNASQFLISNGIDLVDSQVDGLRELSYRASLKKRSLQRTIATREKHVSEYEGYNELEKQLIALKTEGLLDSQIIKKVFQTLKINEEEQNKYLDLVLKFNQERFESMIKRTTIEEEEIELLEIDDLDILDIGPRVTMEALQEVFKHYDYDFSILSDDLIELLSYEGDIEKIESVFESLERNKVDFLKQDGALLVEFLIESSGELIDDGCKVFRDAHVSSKMLKNYKAIFFASTEEINESDKAVYKKRVERADNSVDRNTNETKRKNIPGRHKDFTKNLELFKSMGQDEKTLLERHVMLLTMPHSTVLRHLKELKLYEFPIDNDDFPLSAVQSFRIMALTDSFIELGEENYILQNSSRLTNCPSGTIEKIYALKKAGLPYMFERGDEKRLLGFVTNKKTSCGLTPEQIDATVPKDVDTILKGNKFNELLDNYLPIEISKETLESTFVRQLDERYMRSNLCYNINGVLISRKKFLRNYEFLMNTDLIPHDEKDTEQIALVAAIHKSKLDISEIEKVNNGLNSCMVIGGENNVLLKK